MTNGSDDESAGGGETFILDRLAQEAKRSVQADGNPEHEAETKAGSLESEKKKQKERSIEIKRVQDSKEEKIRLTKPLVVKQLFWTGGQSHNHRTRDSRTLPNRDRHFSDDSRHQFATDFRAFWDICYFNFKPV